MYNTQLILNPHCNEPKLVRESVGKWYIKMYFHKDSNFDTPNSPKRPQKKFTGSLNDKRFLKKVNGKLIDISGGERTKYAKIYLNFIQEKLKTEKFNPYNGKFEKLNHADYPILHFIEDYYSFKTNNVDPDTLEDYKRVIESFSKFIIEKGANDLSLAAMDKTFVAEYLSAYLPKRSIKKSTRDYHLGILKNYFNYLTDIKEILLKSPLKALKKINKSDSDKHKPYTEEEFRAILEYAKSYCYELFILMIMQYYTLSRPSELLRLKKKDIDLVNKRIYFSSDIIKTEKKKVYKIDQVIESLLKSLNIDWESIPENYYFLGNSGKPLSRGKRTELHLFGEHQTDIQIFQNRFYHVKTFLKLDQNNTLYGIKHSGAIKLIELNVPPTKIMQLTGHKSLDMFQIYIRELSTMTDTSIPRLDYIF